MATALKGTIWGGVTISASPATIKPVYYTLTIGNYDTTAATVVVVANGTSFSSGSKQFLKGTKWTASASSSSYDVTLSAYSGILNSNYTIDVTLEYIGGGGC